MTTWKTPRTRTKEQIKGLAVEYLNRNSLASISERSGVPYRTLKSWKAKGFYTPHFQKLMHLRGERVFVLFEGMVTPVRVNHREIYGLYL